MGMMRQRLPPCVQDGDDANLGAEPTRIGGERRHRLGGGLEQDRVNDGLVLEGDRGDRRRQRKDDVEIGNRKQVCFPRGKPRGSGWPLTLRTVTITAGIIGDASHAAVVASLYVAAERLLERTSGRVMTRIPMRVIQVASPQATGDRAGSALPGSYGWRPACSAPSTTNYCARAGPG